MPRVIEIEDINRVILTQLDRHLRTTPENLEAVPVQRDLRLKVGREVENLVVRSFLGPLSFLSRERIVRLLDRLCVQTSGLPGVLDLRNLWCSMAKGSLRKDESFYIRPNRFEQWRRHMHALDEDLPCLVLLDESSGSSIRDPSDLFRSLEYWPTFLRGHDPALARELEKGLACLHLHLSGAYPAPYFWIGLMNDRFESTDLTDLESMPEYLRGYRTEADIKRIAEIIDFCPNLLPFTVSILLQ